MHNEHMWQELVSMIPSLHNNCQSVYLRAGHRTVISGCRCAEAPDSANPWIAWLYFLCPLVELKNGAGSGIFALSSSQEGEEKRISNPRVLSDMGLAIPRPTRLGDPRSNFTSPREVIETVFYTIIIIVIVAAAPL
jgi:hypothetical protein